MVFNTAPQGIPRDAYEMFFLVQSGLPIASGIAVASLGLIYQTVKIEGNGMTPMLSNHEAIVINRLLRHFEPIRLVAYLGFGASTAQGSRQPHGFAS